MKGSIDQNSQLQAQNGMTINELIGLVNAATTAINQQNLDAIAKASALSRSPKPIGHSIEQAPSHSLLPDVCTYRVQRKTLIAPCDGNVTQLESNLNVSPTGAPPTAQAPHDCGPLKPVNE